MTALFDSVADGDGKPPATSRLPAADFSPDQAQSCTIDLRSFSPGRATVAVRESPPRRIRPHTPLATISIVRRLTIRRADDRRLVIFEKLTTTAARGTASCCVIS